jgi:2OG-Fe(II) oxygenase superfamily
VVYLGDVFRGAPERSDILSIIKKKIWTEECRTLWHEGYFSTSSITRHGKKLRSRDMVMATFMEDTRTQETITSPVGWSRSFTNVNRTPEQFTGGSLTLWESDQRLRVEPRHNRAVLFPSFTFHEVEPVHMNSEKWEDGRFSLNYWMGFADPRQQKPVAV